MYCRKIRINGTYTFIYMIHIPEFIPRAFSVIDVMELVYSGVSEFSLTKPKCILKLSTSVQGVSCQDAARRGALPSSQGLVKS